MVPRCKHPKPHILQVRSTFITTGIAWCPICGATKYVLDERMARKRPDLGYWKYPTLRHLDEPLLEISTHYDRIANRNDDPRLLHTAGVAEGLNKAWKFLFGDASITSLKA